MRKIFSFFFAILLCIFTVSCGGGSSDLSSDNNFEDAVPIKLDYANQFSAVRYSDGCVGVKIEDGLEYLIIPEAKEIPPWIQDDDKSKYTFISKPLDSIYLAASSAMDLIAAAEGLDAISMTSTKEADWGIEEIKDKVESQEIQYVGKYSAPDYETILYKDCDLAVESTMIYHNPEVKESLESLEIPVLVERSSYEEHPLGRLEWVKLYGILLDKEEEANEFFDSMEKKFLEIVSATEKKDQGERPEVAFFSISANNYATVRKPGDYIAQMIHMAGGKYAMDELEVANENALSTTNIQLESFYEYVVDSDYLIYNSAIQGEIFSIGDLLDKFQELKGAKAVTEGNVWCTSKSVFQKSSGICDMMEELYLIIEGKVEDENNLEYFHRLQ